VVPCCACCLNYAVRSIPCACVVPCCAQCCTVRCPQGVSRMVLRRPLCCAQWPAIPNLRGATAALVHDVKQPLSVRARGSGQRCANDWACFAKRCRVCGQRLGVFRQTLPVCGQRLGVFRQELPGESTVCQRCANDCGESAKGWPTMCQRCGNVVPTIAAVPPSGQRCANDWCCLAKSPPGSGQRLGLFGQIAARVWPTIGAVWPSGQRCANDWGCLAKWPSGQRCANDWGRLARCCPCGNPSL
jgi:hypothetical protein